MSNAKPATRLISKSIAGASVTGASQALFDDIGTRQGQLAGGFNAIVERLIFNPSSSATIWINPFGGPAAANAADCLSIAPGQGIVLEVVNAINVLGVAGQPITAGER